MPDEQRPNRAEFRTGDGKVVSGTSAIVPIFTTRPDRRMEFLATGFFITNNGVFVTAKHVLMKNDQETPLDNLQVIHFLGDGGFIVRNVLHLNVHKRADVALGVLPPMKHNKTQQELTNHLLGLTSRTPERGSTASTFAYPKTVTEHAEGITRVFSNTSWHLGHVAEHLPNGRDRVLLPNECYRTNVQILHGASGGPAIDANGQVFGVNSTGWDGTDDSYVSSIRCVFELNVPGADLLDGTRNPSVRELIRLGFVLVDQPRPEPSQAQ